MILFVVILIIVLAVILGKMNDHNRKIDRLQIGMDTATVYQIMGSPSAANYQADGGMLCLYEWDERVSGKEMLTRQLYLLFDQKGILTSIQENKDT